MKRGFVVPPDSIRSLFERKYMSDSFTNLRGLGFKHGDTGDGRVMLEKILLAIKQKPGVNFDFELLEFEIQVVEDTRWVDERPTACFIKRASRRSEAVACEVGIHWDSAEAVLKAVLCIGYKLDPVFRYPSPD